MDEIITRTIQDYGYIGILLLIAVENVFPPIPSEIILTFSGFMTTAGDLNVWIVIFCATAGSLIGAVILYAAGRFFSKEKLGRIFESRLGRILRLKKEDSEKAGDWFEKHGSRTIFFCRFIPIIRSVISVPAGISKMNFRTFILLTAAGTYIWNFVLVFLGRFAGQAWYSIAPYFDMYTLITAAVLIFAAICILGIYLKKRFFS